MVYFQSMSLDPRRIRQLQDEHRINEIRGDGGIRIGGHRIVPGAQSESGKAWNQLFGAAVNVQKARRSGDKWDQMMASMGHLNAELIAKQEGLSAAARELAEQEAIKFDRATQGKKSEQE